MTLTLETKCCEELMLLKGQPGNQAVSTVSIPVSVETGDAVNPFFPLLPHSRPSQASSVFEEELLCP